MQINSLGSLLKEFKLHKPSLPSPAHTAKSERNKVVSIPTRAPINRQAALLIQPVRCWASHPPPMPPEKLRDAKDVEIDRLKAELKSERNSHAITNDELGTVRRELKSQKLELKRLQDKMVLLKGEINEKDEIIRQLEDIRL